MVLGDDGIIQNAQAAKEMTKDAEEAEEDAFEDAKETIKKYVIPEVIKEIKEKSESLKNDTELDNIQLTTEEEIKRYISLYDSSEYTFYISNGYVVCVQSEIMTSEKIALCENNGIYLLGDVNGDGIVDDYDSKMISIASVKLFTERQKIVADAKVDANNIINSIDASYIMSNWGRKNLDDALNILENMKKEFNESSAYNNLNITVTEFEEVKEYITSYTDSRYNFAILRGNLVRLKDEDMTSYRIDKCEELQIYRLGDVEADGYIGETDLEMLNSYIAGNYAPTGIEGERFLIVADINYDGVINEEDATILETMVER